MSETANVMTTKFYAGTLPSAGTFPLMHIPAYGGGVTLLKCNLAADGLATAIAPVLITMADAPNGAQVALATIGTLSTGGTSCEFAMGSVAAISITTPYVDPLKWVALKVDADSGGTAKVQCTVAYVTGKG